MKTPEHLIYTQTLEQRANTIPKDNKAQKIIEEARVALYYLKDDKQAIGFANDALQDAAEPYGKVIEERIMEAERDKAIKEYREAADRFIAAKDKLKGFIINQLKQ